MEILREEHNIVVSHSTWLHHQIEEQIGAMVRFTFIDPLIIGNQDDDNDEFIGFINEEKVVETIATEEGSSDAFIDTRILGSQDECDEFIDVDKTSSYSKDNERTANNSTSILLSPLATSWKISTVRAKENLNLLLNDIEQLGTDGLFPPTPRGRIPSSSKQQHTPAFTKGVAKTINISRSSSSDKEQHLMGEEEVGVTDDRNQLIKFCRTVAEKQRRNETAFAKADRALGTKEPQQNNKEEDVDKSTVLGDDEMALIKRISLARGQRMQGGRGTGGGAVVQDRSNKARQKIKEGKLKVRTWKEGDKFIHDDVEENIHVDQKKNKDMAMIALKEVFIEGHDQKMDNIEADDKQQNEGDVIATDETVVDKYEDKGIEKERNIDTNGDSGSVHTINERMKEELEERMNNPSVEDEEEEEETKEFDVLVTDEKMREVLILADENDIEMTVVDETMRETAASDSTTITADLIAAVDDTDADIESQSSSTNEDKEAAELNDFENETNRLLMERQQAVETAVSEVVKWRKSKGIISWSPRTTHKRSHDRKSEEAIVVDQNRSKEFKTITQTVVTENKPIMEFESLDEIEETRQQEENEGACNIEESRQRTDEIEESRRVEENEDTNGAIKVSSNKKRETVATMIEIKETRKTKVDVIIAETDRRRRDDNEESVLLNEAAVVEIELGQMAKEAHDAKRKEHEKDMNRLLREREKVQEQAKLVEAVMLAAVNDRKDKNAYYNILDITPTASAIQIKKAYRKLALRLHPDKLGSYSTPNSLEAFNAVASAYDVLKDVSSRREYDRAQNQCLLVLREQQTAAYTVIPNGTRITVQSTDKRFMKLNGQQGSIMGYNAVSDLYLVKVDNLADSIWSKSSALFQNVIVCLRATKAKELGAFLVTLKAYYRDSRGGCYEVICHDDMTGMIMRRRRAYILPDQFIIPNGTVVHVDSGAFGLVVDWKEKFDHIAKVDSSYYEVRLSSDKICRVLMRNIRV